MPRSHLKALTTPPRAALLAAGTTLVAAATAVWVERRARRAEREHPPFGRLLDVDGVRLHLVERGTGPVVVLIHGNAVSHRDFVASGLIDRLAERHRVIAFDRPGYGHSSRPRDRHWTPSAQAALLRLAFDQLGVDRAVVVGHSMGSAVAVALALDAPERVRGLVLIGGYHYPALRIDALLTAPVALPVLGDALRYTATVVSARLLLEPLIAGMFAPRDVPPDYVATLSREMLLRPVQLRANAEDAAAMRQQARDNSARYAELDTLPVAIIAGGQDRVVDPEANAVRLHDDLPGSSLAVIPGAGHMVHHAAPDAIVAAIEALEQPPEAADD